MLAFEFDERFAPKFDEETRAVIGQINSLYEAGRSYRAIAVELGISKSQAHRLHAKWTPSIECGVRSAECRSEEELIAEQAEVVDEGSWQPESAANEHENTRMEQEIESGTDEEDFEILYSEICIPQSEGRQSVYDLTRSVDGYGREIFIESKDERSGKPTVWYHIDKNGINTRFERNMICVKTERLGMSPYL